VRRLAPNAPGVPLPDDSWAAIVSIARDVGVSAGSIQRAISLHLKETAKGNAINAK
jgi:hypothetical protein